MKIEFKYHDQDEESVHLSEEKAKEELMKFLSRLSDSGKRQWMSQVKDRDYPTPMTEEHFDWIVKRFEEWK